MWSLKKKKENHKVVSFSLLVLATCLLNPSPPAGRGALWGLSIRTRHLSGLLACLKLKSLAQTKETG